MAVPTQSKKKKSVLVCGKPNHISREKKKSTQIYVRSPTTTDKGMGESGDGRSKSLMYKNAKLDGNKTSITTVLGSHGREEGEEHVYYPIKKGKKEEGTNIRSDDID